MREVNITAFSALVDAEERYLRDNGWVKDTQRGSYWVVPLHFGMRAGDVYSHRHAVEAQVEWDSEKLRAHG